MDSREPTPALCSYRPFGREMRQLIAECRTLEDAQILAIINMLHLEAHREAIRELPGDIWPPHMRPVDEMRDFAKKILRDLQQTAQEGTTPFASE